MANLGISRTQRLDQKVIELIPQLSRSFAAKLIEDGMVAVNGQAETKPGHKLRPDDEVRVDYDLRELEHIPDIELPVLYEDNDVVAINKPAGILSHSKGAFNPEATVASWLRNRLHGLSGERAGIVHRLDRATSGVMICAKAPKALTWLQKQFSERKAKKTYFAVVAGVMPHGHAIIDMPIGRNPNRPQTFHVHADGKAAQTEYWVRSTDGVHTLLELQPRTGRTHQLRVHLHAIGHPITGDQLYSNEAAARLFLHAAKLEITLPDRSRRTFSAAIPQEFYDMIKL